MGVWPFQPPSNASHRCSPKRFTSTFSIQRGLALKKEDMAFLRSTSVTPMAARALCDWAWCAAMAVHPGTTAQPGHRYNTPSRGLQHRGLDLHPRGDCWHLYRPLAGESRGSTDGRPSAYRKIFRNPGATYSALGRQRYNAVRTATRAVSFATASEKVLYRVHAEGIAGRHGGEYKDDPASPAWWCPRCWHGNDGGAFL
jgi:hypothetical protein